MEIDVLIEQGVEGCPAAEWLRGIAEKVLLAEGAGDEAELGLVIAGQEKIRDLNRSYRGKDEPTDVLSFFMTQATENAGGDITPFVTPPDGLSHLGEVVISYPQAVVQARVHHHSADTELAVLIIHGVLHLLGYDHEMPEERRRMRAREKAIMSRVSKGTG